MNKLITDLIILLAIGAIAGAIGQVLIKIGISEIGAIKYSNVPVLLKNILKIITNHFVIAGLVFSAIAAFSGMIMLSQNNLSFVYPLCVGALFITVLLMSKLFLKENINPTQFLAIMIIFIGIILLVRSRTG
jgi:drug/metabolite transporter (DMT)-like permease